jgi:DNA-binding MarR family transcriptional regulator
MYSGDMSDAMSDQQTARIHALAHDLRRIAGKLKRRLREQADIGDLTPSQTSVLLRLEKDGPATTSGLARLEGMRPQSMGSIVAALESAGLVSGAPDPTDGRQTLLSLTEHCRTWLGEGRAARQDWLTRTIRHRLSPSEQDQLIAAIALLARFVDD